VDVAATPRLLISGSGVRVSNGPPKNLGRIWTIFDTRADIAVTNSPKVRYLSAFIKGLRGTFDRKVFIHSADIPMRAGWIMQQNCLPTLGDERAVVRHNAGRNDGVAERCPSDYGSADQRAVTSGFESSSACLCLNPEGYVPTLQEARKRRSLARPVRESAYFRPKLLRPVRGSGLGVFASSRCGGAFRSGCNSLGLP
jgi:hypothetical protein